MTFETGDAAYERLSMGETVEAIGLENFNAVTGPVAVRGAAPGDALAIEVLDISHTRLVGLAARLRRARRVAPTSCGFARSRSRTAAPGSATRVTAPIEPMIGCIGVAPASGSGSTFGPACPWGGNMDLRELVPGATLFLPVQVDGALLSMGDLHAAMGAAEATWVSLEAAGQATLRIGLERGMRPRTCRGFASTSETICVGMGESLESAHQAALEQAYELLTGELGLEPFDAYAYASARVGMRFGGPVSPMVLAVVPDV